MSVYKIGDKVRSVAVGSRDSFEGVVTDVFAGEHPNGCCYPTQYVVRDDNEAEWQRTANELRMAS